MRKIFYSATTNGFYPEEMRGEYEKSEDGWPSDAVEINSDDYEFLIGGMSAGKTLCPDGNGFPVLKEPDIDYQALAESVRQNALDSAVNITNDWRTELQLGVIADEDRAKLISWMAYIKEVKALAFDDIKTREDYENIQWPEKPQNVA